jgi:hypothetical protein
MFFARSLLIASAVGGALAQISGVSTQCQSTLIAVAASSSAECLNPSGLLQVFLQGTSGSAVNPIDNWLKGLCALGSCSNDDLSVIVTNVTTGCATDLESFIGNAQPSAITAVVQQAYPTVRKGVCLADASKKNQLCITQTLSNVESVTGPLTLSKILQIVPSIATGSLDAVNLCTPCVKQIYNVAKTDFPTIFGAGDVQSNVQAKCGASFVDGAPDSNIVQTANTGTSPGKNNASTDGSVQITGQQALLSTFLLALLALAA